jgi:MFS family permease
MRRLRWSALDWLDVAAVGVVIIVTLWSLHPSQVFSSSLLTGGDTGSHLALPAYLRSQGDIFHLTPWYPGWFAGMPAYTYYFVLPDYMAVLTSYVIGFAVAFKFATIFGSLLMPVGAYVMARLFRAPRPVPAALALATLPFLFDASFTIDGGNLFSTMAGEYAFSLSMALSLFTIGLFARGVRTGRGYWWAAVALSLTLASHLLPWMFSLAAIGVLVIVELAQRWGYGDPREVRTPGDYARPVRFAVGATLISLALSAWWLVSFATTQNLTNSMGYNNDPTNTVHQIFTTLGWWTSTGAAAGDRWVIIMAAAAALVALFTRDRLGVVLTVLTAGSLLAFIFDPQSILFNERLSPFWFLGIHLLAGWLVGYLAWRWVERQRRLDQSLEFTDEFAEKESLVSPSWREEWGERIHRSRLINAVSVVILVGLLSTVPGLMPGTAKVLHLNTSGNQVTNWAAYNYSGYQGKAAWPEYQDLMNTMSTVAHQYGCGRAMWEYNISEGRFGTPMALMLLPYWTNNCVDSMEGLFFESSATTPYHFLDAAELSANPSNPQVGLDYGPLNVAEGVAHLQMLGVKYYIAFSPAVIAQAKDDASLQLVATTKAWTSPGVQWYIYRIKQSPLVTALTHDPVVVKGLTSRVAWLNANEKWWLNPTAWSVPLASSGPSSWPHASTSAVTSASPTLPKVTVSDVTQTTQSIRFHVSRVGVPVLVKISYYPRWHASGAAGPYRVSPNLMVVVPTSTTVSLTYGASASVTLGNVITDVAAATGLVVVALSLRRRRRTRQ